MCALIDGALLLIRIYSGTYSIFAMKRREGGQEMSQGGNTSLDCIGQVIPCFALWQYSKSFFNLQQQQLSRFHTICIDSAPARLMWPLLGLLHKRYACQTPVHMPCHLLLPQPLPQPLLLRFFPRLTLLTCPTWQTHSHQRIVSAESLPGCRLCCLIHAHYGLVLRRLHSGQIAKVSA